MTKFIILFIQPPIFFLIFFLIQIVPNSAHAAFANHQSVMLGDRAGGMAGAFTALTHDPAAGAYYNPATLARLEGSSLSTSVNLFNKYDINYNKYGQLDDSVFRINKGSIVSIPSATGIFSSFRSFTAGLSIVAPDYQVFGGDVHRQNDDSTFLRIDDRSLWVGGAFAFNISEEQAFGLTIYYTTQSYSRSLMNRYNTGAEIIVLNEEKTYSQNSVVHILGYYTELAPKWTLGISYRAPSIPVSGTGHYLQSQVGTVSGAQPIISDNHLNVETTIPEKINAGVAFSDPRELTISFDVSYYGSKTFTDIGQYGDRIHHNEIANYAFGYEKYLMPWLALRLGVFTDYSSSPKIPSSPGRRYQDRIDKYGFSANLGLHTTKHTVITLGGYYLGGEGHTTERIGPNFERIKKSDRLFSFLVGSAYSF